jgi:hypothetical protein
MQVVGGVVLMENPSPQDCLTRHVRFLITRMTVYSHYLTTLLLTRNDRFRVIMSE